jgi:hypothetical protein
MTSGATLLNNFRRRFQRNAGFFQDRRRLLHVRRRVRDRLRSLERLSQCSGYGRELKPQNSLY